MNLGETKEEELVEEEISKKITELREVLMERGCVLGALFVVKFTAPSHYALMFDHTLSSISVMQMLSDLEETLNKTREKFVAKNSN